MRLRFYGNKDLALTTRMVLHLSQPIYRNTCYASRKNCLSLCTCRHGGQFHNYVVCTCWTWVFGNSFLILVLIAGLKFCNLSRSYLSSQIPSGNQDADEFVVVDLPNDDPVEVDNAS